MVAEQQVQVLGSLDSVKLKDLNGEFIHADHKTVSKKGVVVVVEIKNVNIYRNQQRRTARLLLVTSLLISLPQNVDLLHHQTNSTHLSRLAMMTGREILLLQN